MKISLVNKVAVITGAGGGLGRTYALALAERGAKVIVNDIGSTLQGVASAKTDNIRPADKVVQEIRSSGGTAVANYDSVEDGYKIIETAIKNFGTVHILINNAGILRDKSFAKMTEDDFNKVINVHLKGSYNCTKAAWPYMQKQNYGRIVLTTSTSGIYGSFGQANYSSAKAALIGFGKTLAFEGAKKNIFTNCIAPIAGTRMTETVMGQDLLDMLKPQYVAPVVCYLCSDSSNVNGRVFEIAAGWMSEIRYERSAGFFYTEGFNADDVAAHWDEAVDFSQTHKNTYPTHLNDTTALIIKGLSELSGKKQENELVSAKIFKLMNSYLKANENRAKQIVNKVQSTFAFLVRPSKATTLTFFYVMDLKNGSGSITESQNENVDASFTLTDETCVNIFTGKMNPRLAVQKGLIQVKGSMSAMMMFTDNIFPPITDEMLLMDINEAIKLYSDGVSSTDGTNDTIKRLKEIDLKSTPIIENIMQQLETRDGQKKVEKVKFVYQLDIIKTAKSKPVSFTLDLKSSPPKGYIGSAEKFDAHFTMSDEVFTNIMTGKLNPQSAFIQGKMKVKGNMGAAMKFTPSLFSSISKM